MKATTSSGSPTARTIPRSKAHVPNPSRDPLSIRTVVVTGLPLVDSKSLWKKFRKYEGAEEVQWPIKRDDGVEDASTGSSTHPSPGYYFLPCHSARFIFLSYYSSRYSKETACSCLQRVATFRDAEKTPRWRGETISGIYADAESCEPSHCAQPSIRCH